MVVNPFWFGVLMTIVVEIMVSVLLVIIREAKGDKREVTEEELRKVLEDITGKKFRVIEKDGYLIGEPVEDREDDDDGKA